MLAASLGCMRFQCDEICGEPDAAVLVRAALSVLGLEAPLFWGLSAMTRGNTRIR